MSTEEEKVELNRFEANLIKDKQEFLSTIRKKPVAAPSSEVPVERKHLTNKP